MGLIIKSVNANLVYTMSFLLFLSIVGRDPHYVLTYALLSGITILLCYKTAVKTYNEMNIFIGAFLIYISFILNNFIEGLSPVWILMGLSIGASLTLQTVFYKHPKLFPLNILIFTLFSLFAITGAEFLAENFYYSLILEIGILLSFLAILLNEPRAWSRLITNSLLKLLHPVKTKGVDNIPDKQPVIYIANHPSFWDQLILEKSVPCEPQFYGKNLNDEQLPSFIKKILFFHLNINNEKEINNDYVETAQANLRNNKSVIILPEKQITPISEEVGEWNEDVYNIFKNNECTPLVIPVIIKNIKGQYDLEKGLKRPKKILKPVEVEFGFPIEINDDDDLNNVKKLLEQKHRKGLSSRKE